MKNKTSIISCLIVILIIIILFLLIFVPNQSKKEKKIIINDFGETQEELLVIKNDEDHKLEKNDIVIDEIGIYMGNNSIQINTTLANNSNKDMDGFFAHLEFLDKNGNILFVTAKNYNEKFLSKGKVKIENIVPLNEKNKKVADVRIVHLEQTVSKMVDEAFEKMSE